MTEESSTASSSDSKSPTPTIKKSSKAPVLALTIAFLGYVFIGWLLKGLAVNWLFYAIVATLVLVIPIAAALTEFALIAIAYIISGALAIAALIILGKVETSLVLSIAAIWLGLIAVPWGGDRLLKNGSSKVQAVLTLFSVCSLGLSLGIGIGLLVSQIVVNPPKVMNKK